MLWYGSVGFSKSTWRFNHSAVKFKASIFNINYSIIIVFDIHIVVIF